MSFSSCSHPILGVLLSKLLETRRFWSRSQPPYRYGWRAQRCRSESGCFASKARPITVTAIVSRKTKKPNSHDGHRGSPLPYQQKTTKAFPQLRCSWPCTAVAQSTKSLRRMGPSRPTRMHKKYFTLSLIYDLALMNFSFPGVVRPFPNAAHHTV